MTTRRPARGRSPAADLRARGVPVIRAPLERPRRILLDHCLQLSGADLALYRILPHVGDAEVRVIFGENGPVCGEFESSASPWR